MFGRSEQKPAIDRRRSLTGVPVINGGVTVDFSSPDGARVTILLHRGKSFWARFQPPVMERKVSLDELGTFVLRQIDGTKTTRDIVDAFESHYRVNRREAELSCVEFLRSLAARQAISIVIK